MNPPSRPYICARACVGLPLEGIAIVMGVDRFLDMLRTSVNITGDAMVSIVVNKAEK